MKQSLVFSLASCSFLLFTLLSPNLAVAGPVSVGSCDLIYCDYRVSNMECSQSATEYRYPFFNIMSGSTIASDGKPLCRQGLVACMGCFN